MELAAHWHRCQNLPKKRVTTSRVYRERDDPVKDGLANWLTRSGTLGSVEERYTGTLHGRTSKILATWQKKLGTPSTLAIQTHQQTGKTPYRLQSALLEAGLYLYNTRFTKVDGVPGYASEKNGTIILIKLNELANLWSFRHIQVCQEYYKEAINDPSLCIPEK
jgi:hypothetical protein